MSKRIGGSRRKTRDKLRKPVREKGKISMTRYFQELKLGERVVLKIDSSVHKGMFWRRFDGKSGIVSGMKGKCYMVNIKDGGKPKTVVAHPVHMRRA